MSIYGELDPMVEPKTQFAFKGQREDRTYSQGQHAQYSIPKSTH